MRLLVMAIQFKGGSLQGVVSILRELVKFPEHEYHIVLSKEVKQQLQGIDFPEYMRFYDLPYRCGNRTLNLFLNRAFFNHLERTVHPDCVLCTSGPMYWKSKAPCLMGFNLPHHIYRESPYFKTITFAAQIRRFLRQTVHRLRFRREGTAFFVQTDDVNERLRKYIGCDKVYTVPNTYSVSYRNIEEFPAKLPPRQPGELRCLTISAYYPHKNLGIIRKVVDVLKSRGHENFKFVVTLPAEYYERLFGEGYRASILNVGFVPSREGPSLYQECDFMFLPTLLECFSASYAEAMVMRKPILTSDMGFAHCVCKDAAIYYNPVDANEIADKLIALANDQSLQESLVAKGTQLLTQFGTSLDRVQGILRLCENLAKSGK
ncbi:MAG: glycosyltransferase [Victivallales bacterium]|nr:glycosyltransferase [Victivallales bacterium]